MYKPPYNPLFDDPNNPRAAYNKRYRFLYYLSGLGMKVYNKVKYGLETDLYTRLFAHLVRRDGFDVTLSAPCTLYWDNEPLDEPYQVPMLINNNVIVDIYTQPLIAALERSRLEHRHVTDAHLLRCRHQLRSRCLLLRMVSPRPRHGKRTDGKAHLNTIDPTKQRLNT